MPVEVRELVIKAAVQHALDGDKKSKANQHGKTPAVEIVNMCLDKLVSAEKERKER